MAFSNVDGDVLTTIVGTIGDGFGVGAEMEAASSDLLVGEEGETEVGGVILPHVGKAAGPVTWGTVDAIGNGCGGGGQGEERVVGGIRCVHTAADVGGSFFLSGQFVIEQRVDNGWGWGLSHTQNTLCWMAAKGVKLREFLARRCVQKSYRVGQKVATFAISTKNENK